MLTSLGIIWIVGLLLGGVAQKIKLPALIGMIAAGVLIGPEGLNLLDDTMITMSPVLRQLALVIILTRAGLALDLKDLKQVGRPALLLCFLPATLEIIGIVLIAPLLFEFTLIEAAITGCVLAAVSPAVVVPRMIRMIEEGYGVRQSIPQMILAGASVDDVYVIVLFTAFTTIATGGMASVMTLIEVPTGIAIGILAGVIMAFVLLQIWKCIPMRHSACVVMLMSVSFLLLELEERVKMYLPMAALLGIMTMGIVIYQKDQTVAKGLAAKYQKLWVGAEILLFVLVGASVELTYIRSAGIYAILLVLVGLCMRMLGVWCSTIRTPLLAKERAFCMVAYTPKATVQAAIGGIPMALGLECGAVVLTIAVLAIVITAPFGAICTDRFYRRWTSREERSVI